MSANYKNFSKGIALIANVSDLNTLLGDLNVFGIKLMYHNGTVSDALVSETVTATLTNKTLSGNTASNLINGSGVINFNSSGTITVPNATDTLVGKATTDTLTNKTIAAGSNTISGLTNSNLSGSAAITNANLAQMAAHTFKGNNTGSSATPLDLTISQMQSELSVPTSSSPLALNAGGTGISAASANAAFNALSPMTTGGDIIYGGASGVATRLSNGSNGQVLTSSGGTSAPSWVTPASAITGSYSQAFFDSGYSWTTTSTSFVDPTSTTVGTFTVRTSNGITLTAAASNVAGVTFTPASSSAIYLITVQVAGFNNNAAGVAAFRLTDGTNTISGNAGVTGTPVYAGQTMTGIYAPGTSSSVTVKVQSIVIGLGSSIITSASGNANSIPLEFTIMRIS